ncbi:MAG: AMP-binding protein, partial [Acetobacteraceae bacterium]|nr:AMP-binding protein [Acetobacteraceae bacterium]
WRDYFGHVRDFAAGLVVEGFRRGDRLAVIGDNRPRLYAAQLAAHALGGVAVPVYQDAIAAELAYVLAHAGVSVLVAEDQEQTDKILSLRNRLPALRRLIYDDPRGMTFYRDDLLTPFAAVETAGKALLSTDPGLIDRAIDACVDTDVALIAYTSGTTGAPKGAMISHHNMITAAENFATAEDIRAGDEWLSYLPMAWLGDAAFSLALSLVAGMTTSCPESPETVQRDLRELGPTGLIAPPRIWEAMLSDVTVRISDASSMKRTVFERFRALAERRELLRAEGKPVSAALRLRCAIGEALIYRPLRDRLGLVRSRACYTGGAPLGPDTFRFFRGIGINLKQIYGATEVSALLCCQPDGEADPDSVGRPLPQVEVRIAEDGEVEARAPGVFAGYYRQDEATAATFTEDGWLRMGDAGFFDRRGHLVVIDRARDVGKLANGEPFAPQFIENKVKYSPFVREAVAFGNACPFVAVMIAIDMGTVGNWAEKHGLAYTSYMDLAGKPAVAELIRAEIAKCNATLPEGQRVRRFLLLAKELDADDAEMTRTRKVRRRFVAEKYAAVIEAFYDGVQSVETAVEITYEDGRKASVKSAVAIHDVETRDAMRRAA